MCSNLFVKTIFLGSISEDSVLPLLLRLARGQIFRGGRGRKKPTEPRAQQRRRRRRRSEGQAPSQPSPLCRHQTHENEVLPGRAAFEAVKRGCRCGRRRRRRQHSVHSLLASHFGRPPPFFAHGTRGGTPGAGQKSSQHQRADEISTAEAAETDAAAGGGVVRRRAHS